MQTVEQGHGRRDEGPALTHTICCCSSTLCREADRLFQEEDEEKFNTAIEDNGNGSIDQTAHALREAMESSSIGAIVNAQCIITMVNKVSR